MALNFSLGKKKDVQPVAPPVWHPDFRDVSRLPDTKVVRTAFFVTTAAIAVAVALLIWVGYREIDLRNLQEQINTAQAQLDANSRQNGDALKLSKVFADEQKKLAEVIAFQQAAITPTELISLLAEILPPEISLETVDLRLGETPATSGAQMKALVAGAPDQASGAASRYVDALRAHPRLGAVFDPITLTSLNRNASRGFLSVEISLKFKTEVKK